MSKFLSYLRNDKGGVVEYVLVVAAIGGIVVAVMTNPNVKTAANTMFQSVFDTANKKATF